jgi:Protein of unknown function (DUF3551)
MRRSFIIAAMVSISTVTLATAASAPALAQSYPFCLLGNEAVGSECDFTTLEQCRATASGIGSSCGANPAYAADAHASASPDGGRRIDRRAYRRTSARGAQSRE